MSLVTGTIVAPQEGFFRDHRLNYLSFVANTDEKQAVAARIIEELYKLDLAHAASLNIFDAGIGDATILAKVLSAAHAKHKNLPFYIVGKEISGQDIRIVLPKMAHVFYEHPETVLVINNLAYKKSPWNALSPNGSGINHQFKPVAVTGETSYEFANQFEALEGEMPALWQNPAALVVYRKDQEAKLKKKKLIPSAGFIPGDGFDLAIASQPYQLVPSAVFIPGGGSDPAIASQPYQLSRTAEWKAKTIIWPLIDSLRAGGAMIGIHSRGGDPADEMVRQALGGFTYFKEEEAANIVKAVRNLTPEYRRDQFDYGEVPELLRYHLRNLSEGKQGIGTPILDAAWGAAVYVAQVPDVLLQNIDKAHYEAIVTALLDQYRGHEFDKLGSGCWFNDDVYTIHRRQAQPALVHA